MTSKEAEISEPSGLARTLSDLSTSSSSLSVTTTNDNAESSELEVIELASSDPAKMLHELAGHYNVPEILVKSLFDLNSRNRSSDGRLRSNDRAFILNLENEIVEFIVKPNVDSWKLTPLNSYYRLLTHKLAEYYNLGHILSNDGYSMVLFKINTSLVNADDEIKKTAKFDQDGNIKPLDFRNLKFDPREKLNRVKLAQLFAAYKTHFHCTDSPPISGGSSANSSVSQVGLPEDFRSLSLGQSGQLPHGVLLQDGVSHHNIRIMKRRTQNLPLVLQQMQPRSSPSGIVTSAASATTSVHDIQEDRLNREERYRLAKERIEGEHEHEEAVDENEEVAEEDLKEVAAVALGEEGLAYVNTNVITHRRGGGHSGGFRQRDGYHGYKNSNQEFSHGHASGGFNNGGYGQPMYMASPPLAGQSLNTSPQVQPGMPPYPYFNPYMYGYQFVSPQRPTASASAPNSPPLTMGHANPATAGNSPNSPTVYPYFYMPPQIAFNPALQQQQQQQQQQQGDGSKKDAQGGAGQDANNAEVDASLLDETPKNDAVSFTPNDKEMVGNGTSSPVPPQFQYFYPTPFMGAPGSGIPPGISGGPANGIQAPPQQYMAPYFYNNGVGQRFRNGSNGNQGGGHRHQQYRRFNNGYARGRGGNRFNNSNNSNNYNGFGAPTMERRHSSGSNGGSKTKKQWAHDGNNFCNVTNSANDYDGDAGDIPNVGNHDDTSKNIPEHEE